jgi:CO/xanthine dehydrogenase Mo-binding subunit
VKTTRREFLGGSGALVVYFSLPAAGAMSAATAFSQDQGLTGNAALDTWISIDAGGAVRISSGKVELGQGIRTALAQIAAEELDIGISRVVMTTVDTARSPDESYTFSSLSIMQSGSRIRKAAAEARRILLELAATELGIPAGSLGVSDGCIYHSGRKTDVDYWSLLEGKNFNTALPEDIKTKPFSEYGIVGKSVERLDIPGKVYGDLAFLQDLRLEGMTHARVVRPPADRAQLLEVDASAVERMDGVIKVVRDGSFLAVVAEREYQADQAAEKLRTGSRWQLPGDLPDDADLPRWLRSEEAKTYPVVDKENPVAPQAVARLKASYSKPYIAHGAISPSAAVALKKDEDLTVWSHGQGMYPLRGAISSLVGLEESRVRCIHMEASGCYGHNGGPDAACDAAVIAMQLPRRPVRVQWSRADEFQWEPYGPAMSVEIEAGLDEEGHVVDWDCDLWSCTHSTRSRGASGAGNLLYAQHRADPVAQPPPASIPQPAGGGDRNSIPLYDFPRVRVDKHLVQKMPLKVSALRGLGAYANIFAIESFMDEAALAAGADPFEYRLRHLKDERAIAVLKKLREISNWQERPAANSGTGWGISFARFKNLTAYVAMLMRLKADPDPETGAISLKEAIAVVDAGLIVNPDGTRAQIEGGIVQSASWTLKEQIRFRKSEIHSRDWLTYPILKFDEVPDVRVEIINRPELPSLGLGEAAQGPTAAAIANAVFHATGRRIRDLPLTPERVIIAG